MRNRVIRWACVLLVPVVASCQGDAPRGDGDAAGAVPETRSGPGATAYEPQPEISAHLDSGTVAYRDGRLEDARRHYRRAAEMNPHLAASWFGVHMAEKALGNQEAADSALAQVRALAPAATPPPGHEGRVEGGSVYQHGEPASPRGSGGADEPVGADEGTGDPGL